MFSKIRIVLIGLLAAVLALGGATAAFAQEDTPPAAADVGTRWGGGVVTAVGADNFTVRNRLGEHVIYVDGATLFFNGEGTPASFADLHVGDRVAGVIERRGDGKAYAKLVIIFPPQTRYKGIGVITAVDAGEQSFNFVNRRGKLWEFYVDDATQITNRAGETLTFADLHAGQRAFVAAELRDDGKWWATEVKVPVQP